ncbi:MAG: hypothetical protein WKF75_15765 [Singulisphaera sp.]
MPIYEAGGQAGLHRLGLLRGDDARRAVGERDRLGRYRVAAELIAAQPRPSTMPTAGGPAPRHPSTTSC